MRREQRESVSVQRPTVLVRGEGRYVKRTGGPGQYGHCVLEIGPLPREGGFVFEDRTTGGVIPGAFIASIEQGVREAMQRGIVAGYPVVDLYVAVVDGSAHPIDSTAYAFQTAAMLAFRDACAKADMVVLEPVATAEIVAPSAFVGTLLADLGRRRGLVMRQESAPGATTVLSATVPLAEMFGYATALRSLTQGRASFTLTPSGYAEAPASVAAALRA